MYINGILETINGEVIGYANDIYVYYRNKIIEIVNDYDNDIDQIETKINRITKFLKTIDDTPIATEDLMIVRVNDTNEYEYRLLEEREER